jgi:hypothetical protein
MTKKQIIISLSSLLVASYIGFFIYQRVQRRKSDEALDSYEDALEKLREAKESAAPLYIEPDLESLKEDDDSDDEAYNVPSAMIDDKAYELGYSGYA